MSERVVRHTFSGGLGIYPSAAVVCWWHFVAYLVSSAAAHRCIPNLALGWFLEGSPVGLAMRSSQPGRVCGCLFYFVSLFTIIIVCLPLYHLSVCHPCLSLSTLLDILGIKHAPPVPLSKKQHQQHQHTSHRGTHFLLIPAYIYIRSRSIFSDSYW